MDNRIVKQQIDFFGNAIETEKALRKNFIEPPFSVLDTKSENWIKRKREWAKLGMKSELGRNDNYMAGTDSFANEKYGKTAKNKLAPESIFDPALCELMYNWYCPVGGLIRDPFAGGSVRGIVAHYLGFKYRGIDIRSEQIESNYLQSKEILPEENQPVWIVGDSSIKLMDEAVLSDFLFSCPPYADLEVYSDLSGDISNMKYDEFLKIYRDIIFKSCMLLKDGCFAVWVVGDIRDKKTGELRNFTSDTVKAFQNAGMQYWNEIILLNAIGTAMMRVGNTFGRGNKKVVKVHQNVLVFYKPENKDFNFTL